MNATLIIYLNQFILQLYQTYKNLKSLDWIIDSVIDHTINISKYKSVAGSSYIRLPKELDHPRKGLKNIQNIDYNESFKWCLVRYFHHTDHNPGRITKAGKDFAKELDFKDIKFTVKIRNIHKIGKKNSIGIIVSGFEDKKKYPICVSNKCCEDKHVHLLLVGEGEKQHHVLIKYFNTFMCDDTLHRGRKHFCRYYLQAFSTEEILKRHIKDCFKINAKKMIKMPKKCN